MLACVDMISGKLFRDIPFPIEISTQYKMNPNEDSNDGRSAFDPGQEFSAGELEIDTGLKIRKGFSEKCAKEIGNRTDILFETLNFYVIISEKYAYGYTYMTQDKYILNSLWI